MGFFDRDLHSEILKRVYKPDPVPKPRPRPVAPDNRPRPATNYVEAAISNWLEFCRRFGLNPGSQTNIAQVDWRHTWVFSKPLFCRTGDVQVTVVTFSNSMVFNAVDGVVFAHSSPDAYWRGSEDSKTDEERKSSDGVATKDWLELARDLQALAIRQLGTNADILNRCRPFPDYVPAEVGKEGLVRVLVFWHQLPRPPESDIDEENLRSPMDAELDTRTGELKVLCFHDPRLLGWKAPPAARTQPGYPKVNTFSPFNP